MVYIIKQKSRLLFIYLFIFSHCSQKSKGKVGVVGDRRIKVKQQGRSGFPEIEIDTIGSSGKGKITIKYEQ